MKKMMTVLAMTLFVSSTLSTSVMANAHKGQKIFKKKFRKRCGFSGVRFARNHTSSEWEDIWDEGKFQQEAKKICPRLNIRKIHKKWWKHVYDFSYKYASDGIVPKC